MVLQSLPANAWLLWRFALQSHQFWLGTKSQKSRITQNNFKFISCKLSSIPLSCTIEKKSQTLRRGERRCQKFVMSKIKSNPELSNLIWWISQSNKNPSFPKEISDYSFTFPTKKKEKKKKVCVLHLFWLSSRGLHCTDTWGLCSTKWKTPWASTIVTYLTETLQTHCPVDVLIVPPMLWV